jgi:pimeloyl-ACP methyl ester carboxylesterase
VLFFIHGFPDDARVWSNQLAHFSKEYRVIAPHLRGAAGSEPGEDRSRFDLDAVALDHLEILRAALTESPNTPVVVVGHDIGGPHAWHLARLLGPQLAGLVLINAPDLGQMGRKLSNPRQLLKSWYIGVILMPKIPELVLERLEDSIFRSLPSRTEKPSALLGHYREFFARLRRHPAAILARSITRLDAPVLVLWGAKDPYLLPPTEQEMKRLASRPQIRILEGGHWLQHERHDKVNTLIENFLKQEARP